MALRAVVVGLREFDGHISILVQNAFDDLRHEHRPAGRPAKTTPLYPVLAAQGAAFGVVNGWERTSFNKPTPDFVEEHSYRYCNWHDVVAAEDEAVQTRVGIAELSGFNRFQIKGTDVAEWIGGLTCTKLPKAKGRVGLCYFLSENGNIDAEATIASLAKITCGTARLPRQNTTIWIG